MIETAFQINIGQIIQKKTGKTLPKVAVRLLEKLIHQDELNEFLATDGKDKVGLDFVKASLKFLGINVRIIGEENLKIDKNSRLCFVCNHPLGGIDGLTMLKVIGEKCDGNVKVIVNSFLAELQALLHLSSLWMLLVEKSQKNFLMLIPSLKATARLLCFRHNCVLGNSVVSLRICRGKRDL